MKNIWIINQYITSPEIKGDGYRHYYIAKYLQKTEKYNPLLITSSFSHIPYRHNKFKGLYKIIDKGIKTLILKGNKYSNPYSMGRAMSWVIFSFNLLIVPFLSMRKIPKPDIIILSSLPFLPILNILLFKKIFYPKVKFIFEIRDLWPSVIIEQHGYSNKNPLIKFLSFLEKKAYLKADYIISVLPKANERIRYVLGHSNFNFKWITNGYEISKENFNELDLKNILNTEISKNTFNIGYAGTLVTVNPLDTIIKIVNDLKDKNINLYILGYGSEKERLVNFSKDFKNVFFLEQIPKVYVSKFLSKMDLLYMGKGKKNTTVHRYGTSQLKAFDYFYAKKPIIQALNSKDDPISLSKAGYVIPPEDEDLLKEKILYFYNLEDKERLAYGMRGYNYLINNCTYEIISKSFEDVLFYCLSNQNNHQLF